MILKTKNLIYVILLFFCSIQINAQNDCVDAIVICGNTGFSGLTATGVGISELSPFNVCSSQENNSIWLKLSIDTAGTLAFTLTPESDDIEEDFDFWLFGPNVTCGSIGTAIRCSTTNPLLSGAFDNLTGMNDVETDVSEGPGTDGNNYVQSVAANVGDTYFLVIDRPIGFSNFSLQWTGNATFNQQPVVPIVNLDLQMCDTDSNPDNSTAFDLTQNDATIIGSQTGITITYHTSSNDAITGENSISSPGNFANTTNPQTIYARLTNLATGCFDKTEFSIEVANNLTIQNDTYTICDDASDGDGLNGKTNFDLNDVINSVFSPEMLAVGLTIKFYNSSFNAINNIGAFNNANLYYNNTPNQESIYVMAMNTVTGCSIIKEIILKVVPQPIIANNALTQCDIGLVPDGITLFNLNEIIPSFTGNDPDLTIAFFESGNPLPVALNYTNTSNPQVLIATVTNSVTGCSASANLTLTVNLIAPRVVTIPAQCDIINIENGIGTFDLNTTDLVLGPTETVQFYENSNDALIKQNPITYIASYSNTTAYHSTIYVRVDDGNNCSFISTLELVVNKLPQAIRTSDGLYICSDIPENYITLNAAITEGVPSDYTYVWQHDGNALSEFTYEIHVNQAGIYTVDITALGCTLRRTITVLESNHAIIESIVVNDFMTDINTIRINLNSLSLGEYQFALNNINGPFQESAFFDDVAPGVHELYIKDLKACGTIGPIPINVLGIPQFFTPNGDGYNDTWNMKGVNAKLHKKSLITIFDRQGKLLKEISPNGPGWDGTYNKKPLPSEDYWYHITLEDGRSTKGHFTLKR